LTSLYFLKLIANVGACELGRWMKFETHARNMILIKRALSEKVISLSEFVVPIVSLSVVTNFLFR
jgi:hypothetical protein